MSTLKQIIRLHHQGKGIKTITRICNTARNTVRKYIALYQQLPFTVEELLETDDQTLEQLVLPSDNRPQTDRFTIFHSQFDYFLSEMDRVGVSRTVLWNEYIRKYPEGYSYPQFCHYLLQYQKLQKTTMVMNHNPGDLLYVDFAGHPLEYIAPSTGEVIKVQVFVACLGYSQYSFIQAVPSQKSADFMAALNKCLAYLGGVPQGIVPDNLKAAVIKTDRYEPELNRLLEDWANHNKTTVIPARAAKPKDKSLVENLVKQAYSRIYAPLRDRRFYSLEELNAAIKERLNLHNEEKFKRKDYSRKDLFVTKEKELLKPLPAEPFKVKKYRHLTLQKNCHIYLSEDKHYYSAPLAYIGQKLEVVYTSETVAIYACGKKVAHHIRSLKAHGYTTVAEHLPSHYQKYKDRSPEYYLKRAAYISNVAETVVKRLFASKKHPEALYKSCEGILTLASKTDKEEFNNACKMALEVGACNFSFIRNVLSNRMAQNYQEESSFKTPGGTPNHQNIRGKSYFK